MSRYRFCFCVLCAILTAAIVGLLVLAPQPVQAQVPRPVSFINDVAPILKENCFACHDAKKRKGKLDMTTFENFRKGGTKDDPVVSGKPEESLIVDLITAKDNRMPPKEAGDPLPRVKAEVLVRWIKEGAKLDAGIDPKADLLRELRVRWQPPAPPRAYPRPALITALAFTPDGKKLVVSGQHELLVWDVAAGKLERRIRTRAERSKAMLFLPDGNLVVAGSRPGQEGDLRVYNIHGGTPRMEDGVVIVDGVSDKSVMLKELLEVDDEVLCLAATPDGKKLAAGGCDRTVRVWDLSAGFAHAKMDTPIENHADWVFGVAFTPDGKYLLTASRDKTAKVWDLAAKESLLTFPEHQNGVFGVAATPDGKLGISVGQDAQIRWWNIAPEGKQVRNAGGHGKDVFKVLYHPKKPWLITCGADNTVRVWDANSGGQLRTLSGHTDWVLAVALSPDGNLLVSGSWNGEMKIWKVDDGSLVKSLNPSPGGQQVASTPAKK